MANLASVLDQTVGSVERPKVIPPGNYICQVSEIPKEVEMGKDKLPAIEFQLRVVQPTADVDAAAYQEAAAATPNGVTLRYNRFIQSQAGQFGLQELLKNVFDAPQGMSFREALAQCVGKQAIVTVKHQPSKDGKNLYAQADDVAHI